MKRESRESADARQPLEKWDVRQALELYEVDRWGDGYFDINDQGRVCVRPGREHGPWIDLKDQVDRLQQRGVDPPILFRFGQIIESRLRDIQGAFAAAIDEYDYRGDYCCVYPIKVNQQRQVVEEVLRGGALHGFGLEVGSKPELLAVMAMADNAAPIICNGFKDAEYIETAMLARKMGRNIVPVVERSAELDLILKVAANVGVRPTLGMRVKLATRGAGRWQSSTGRRSKFGLTASELLRGLEHLQRLDMADCFKLLHFHLGSQITNIRIIKTALTEAARVYVELAKRGAGLRYLDVGGGLGVDYDGSQTDFQSSMNYSLQEYANDVVYYVRNVCDEAEVPHPTIVSESGRMVVAHHSVLVFNVLGVSGRGEEPEAALPEGAEQPLVDLRDTLHDLASGNMLESYHDAEQALDMAMHLFSGGYLPLDQRSQAENLYGAICRRIIRLLEELEETPEELRQLNARLSETYFCNFSLFQSIPDSWAIGQLFPIMPIHRLDERPTRPAVLGDMTCDSDGKIDRFIGGKDKGRSLLVHPFDGKPYLLGAFLVGAYQEILGDLHNLFGDTNAVHVRVDETGEVVFESIVKGDTVRKVLGYVDYEADVLINRLRSDVEQAVGQERLNDDQAGRLMRFYEQALEGYTYLEEGGET